MIPSFGREEETRTPDPDVPNVVRYQLRYFSILPRKISIIYLRKFSRSYESGCKGTAFFLYVQIFEQLFCTFSLKSTFSGL